MADGRAPKRALREDVCNARSQFRLCSDGLVGRPPLEPCREPKQTQQANADKHRAPTVFCNQRPCSECSDGRTEANASHQETIGEAAALFRQVASQNL